DAPERPPQVDRVAPRAAAHHLAERAIGFPRARTVGGASEPVDHAVTELGLVVSWIGGAGKCDRLLRGLEALWRARHHPANPPESRQVDVRSDVHDDEPLDAGGVGARVADGDPAA